MTAVFPKVNSLKGDGCFRDIIKRTFCFSNDKELYDSEKMFPLYAFIHLLDGIHLFYVSAAGVGLAGIEPSHGIPDRQAVYSGIFRLGGGAAARLGRID